MTKPRTIAALYVEERGVYAGLPGVEVWGVTKDARTYAGPHAALCHPPCQRFGKYWHGGPSVKVRMVKGDDGGCFAAALASVRRWGGVIEHPEASAAWEIFGLRPPPFQGGWVPADWPEHQGWTARVEQGHYGHRARKGTWLYVHGVTSLPALKWGPSAREVKLDHGYHSAEERRAAVKPPAGRTIEQRAKRREWLAWYSEQTGKEWRCPERMGKRERAATPVEFRDLLLEIARSAKETRP